jgi:CDP-diacylglycerol--serine O-phosphatidyltransferase
MLDGAHLANTVTYVGVAAAVAGLGWAGAGEPAWALACLAAAGIADLFDGAVARLFQRTVRQRLLGVALDSLADVVCFLALPAAVALAVGPQLWAGVVATLYVVAGLTRLAHFDAAAYDREAGAGPPVGAPEADRVRPQADPGRGASADGGGRVPHYRGLPVTYAALVLPLAGLAALVFAPAALGWALTAGLAALAPAFLCDVRIPKPRGAWYVVFPVVAVAVAIGLWAAR